MLIVIDKLYSLRIKSFYSYNVTFGGPSPGQKNEQCKNDNKDCVRMFKDEWRYTVRGENIRSIDLCFLRRSNTSTMTIISKALLDHEHC